MKRENPLRRSELRIDVDTNDFYHVVEAHDAHGSTQIGTQFGSGSSASMCQTRSSTTLVAFRSPSTTTARCPTTSEVTDFVFLLICTYECVVLSM